MPMWEEFTVVTGGAAAALVGLLFVAVSLRIETIARSRDLRSRAAQTLTLFVIVLIVAIVLTVPEQRAWILGVELIVVALFGGAVLFTLNRRAERSADAEPLARILDIVSPNIITMVLIALSGALYLSGLEWGLYFLVPAVVAALVGGVVSAWLFMTQVPAAETQRTP